MTTQVGSGDGNSQLLRGALDLCLLAVMERESVYGYAIVKTLGDAGLDVAAGTIYPALARLRRQGLVAVEQRPGVGGPPRTYYRTTAAGTAAGRRLRGAWRAFADSVDRVTDAARVSGGGLS